MALKNLLGQGPNFVGSYQLSGVPYVTSSATDEVTSAGVGISFPNVTRWVEVRNNGSKDLRVGFTLNGVLGVGGSVSGSSDEATANHSNYFILPAVSGSTTRWEARCTQMWFATATGESAFSVAAGLTGVIPRQYPILTGSNGFVGVG